MAVTEQAQGGVTTEWAETYRRMHRRIHGRAMFVTVLLPIGLLVVTVLITVGVAQWHPAAGLITFMVGGLAFIVVSALIPETLIGSPATDHLACPGCGAAVIAFGGFAAEWPAVAYWRIDWQCRRCGHPHGREAGL